MSERVISFYFEIIKWRHYLATRIPIAPFMQVFFSSSACHDQWSVHASRVDITMIRGTCYWILKMLICRLSNNQNFFFLLLKNKFLFINKCTRLIIYVVKRSLWADKYWIYSLTNQHFNAIFSRYTKDRLVAKITKYQFLLTFDF